MKELKKIPLIIHQRYLPLINDYSLNKHIQIQNKSRLVTIAELLLFGQTVVIGVAIVPFK